MFNTPTTVARARAWCVLLSLLGAIGAPGAAAQAPIVVFPDSATIAPRLLSGGPYQASFLVQHKGPSEALAFTCTGMGGITCTAIAPAAVPVRGQARPEASEVAPSPPTPAFTCTKAAALTCTSAEPTRGRLGHGRLTPVVVTYTVSALGTGKLVLRAEGEASRQADAGQLTIPIVATVDSTAAPSPGGSSTGT